jgi:hypothetical protein
LSRPSICRGADGRWRATSTGLLGTIRDEQTMIGRHTLWHSLGNADEDAPFLETSMRELLALLHAEPLALNIAGEPLKDGAYPNAIQQLKNGNLSGGVDAVRKACGTMTKACRIGLVVYCDPYCPPALAARRMLPHAAWGISLSGTVSAIYARNNKYAIWHETLHLLGALDHYDLKSYQRTCESPGCIMQYAPDEPSISKGPIFCEKTVAILWKACGSHG